MAIMNRWIMSWFKTLETNYELEISHKLFNEFLESKASYLGNTAMFEIVKHVSSIITHKKQLLNPFWNDVCTFEYIGDSIVECANYPIKKEH